MALVHVNCWGCGEKRTVRLRKHSRLEEAARPCRACRRRVVAEVHVPLAAELARRGLPQTEIAASMGISQTTVSRYLKRAGDE